MIRLQTPYEIAMDTAVRFRRMRKAKGVTMKELSERSGVPYATVRRFEHTGEVSFLSLVKMTSALNEDREITALFADRIPGSIEEIIRENRG